MLRNNFGFIFVFLPSAFLIDANQKRKCLTEAAQSLLRLFYSRWSICHLLPIFISMLCNYKLGRSLASLKHRQKATPSLDISECLILPINFNLSH